MSEVIVGWLVLRLCLGINNINGIGLSLLKNAELRALMWLDLGRFFVYEI